MEKLPFGAVTSRNGITECRNTEFDIRWKCSKVIRVAKLNGFRILRTQQRALSQCHFFGDGPRIVFLVCFLFFPLIDGSCDACCVCCGGLSVIGFCVEFLDVPVSALLCGCGCV